eukprot:s4012_g1.t1
MGLGMGRRGKPWEKIAELQASVATVYKQEIDIATLKKDNEILTKLHTQSHDRAEKLEAQLRKAQAGNSLNIFIREKIMDRNEADTKKLKSEHEAETTRLKQENTRLKDHPCSNSASLLASTAFHFIRLTEVKLQRAIQEWGCRVAADGSLTFPFLNFGNMPFATAEFVVVNLTTQVEYQLCEGENFQRQFQWFAPQNEDVYMREFWFTAGQDRNAADIGNASATIACNVVNTRSLEDVLKELRDQDDESTVKMLESELAYAMSQVEELKGQLNEIQKRRKGGKKEGNDGSKRLKLTEGNDDSKRLKLTEGDDEAGGQA